MIEGQTAKTSPELFYHCTMTTQITTVQLTMGTTHLATPGAAVALLPETQ